MTTHTLKLSDEELNLLENIMWHFDDYLLGDDRPDHGIEKLKSYRGYPAIQMAVHNLSKRLTMMRCRK